MLRIYCVLLLLLLLLLQVKDADDYPSLKMRYQVRMARALSLTQYPQSVCALSVLCNATLTAAHCVCVRYQVMISSAGIDAISLRQGTVGGRPAARFSVVEDRKRHEEYAAWGASLYSDATSLLMGSSANGSNGLRSRSLSAESLVGSTVLEEELLENVRRERPAPGVCTSYRSCPYP